MKNIDKLKNMLHKGYEEDLSENNACELLQTCANGTYLIVNAFQNGYYVLCYVNSVSDNSSVNNNSKLITRKLFHFTDDDTIEGIPNENSEAVTDIEKYINKNKSLKSPLTSAIQENDEATMAQTQLRLSVFIYSDDSSRELSDSESSEKESSDSSEEESNKEELQSTLQIVPLTNNSLANSRTTAPQNNAQLSQLSCTFFSAHMAQQTIQTQESTISAQRQFINNLQTQVNALTETRKRNKDKIKRLKEEIDQLNDGSQQVEKDTASLPKYRKL